MPDARKVFIVEDDEPALTSLTKLLMHSGFKVEGTTLPRDAVRLIKTFSPQIILLDLLMPGIGGFEICEMLNSGPNTAAIPIIITSALGGDIDIKHAYRLGVVGYFTKPYDFSKLIAEINKAIDYKEGKSLT